MSRLLGEVRARLRNVLGPETRHPGLRLPRARGTLTIEGEVDGVASEKRAGRAVVPVPEMRLVVDRPHVRPSATDG